MPVHDWTRVTAGTFHDFHNAWITELRNALNGGVLPEGYYAQGEQRAGDIGPDLLALPVEEEPAEWRIGTKGDAGGTAAVLDSLPKARMTFEANRETAFYLARRRKIVIYHASGDRIVALIEILSPANKHSRQTIDDFVDKAMTALHDGYHLLVIDLFPPNRHDPTGIHGQLWEHLSGDAYQPPEGQPLTLAAYCARSPIAAYVEPLAVGSPLIDMPLFLTPDHYVNVPLEATYAAAYRGVPQRWRRVIEGLPPGDG